MCEPSQSADPNYAMVEIFGHRSHYGEIRDVTIAGGTLLEVRDVDTDKVHLYGAGVIFSLTPLSKVEIDAHIVEVKRRRDQENEWRRERDARAQSRLMAPEIEHEGLGFDFLDNN